MNRQTSGGFGKYRDLVIAIGLFLVLDLGVLTVSVYTSRQIEIDTAQINAGGDLRMYSQQLTKALLTLQSETAAGLPNQTSMAQIAESHEAFRAALLRLKQAADSDRWAGALGEQDGSGTKTQQLLDKIEAYWGPMDEVVVPLRASPDPAAGDVEIAATKFVARNLRLMYLADDLARHLEATAIARASLLRRIQFIAILLALLNFVFIVVKFVRRLRASDRAAEAARAEVAQILGTMHEGVFLVTRDGHIGGQRSASLDALFGRRLRPGEDFREMLRALVAPAEFETAQQYIDLLFTDRIKASLMEQLNPLREVEVTASQSPPQRATYLDFEFEQVREAGKVSALLVTVFDVSERIRLARALASAEQRAKTEVDLLLGILGQEPRLLTAFVAAAEERLGRINADLQAVRSDARAYAGLVEQVLRAIHGIKGEAMMLNLETVAREAHACEDGLARLRARDDLSGVNFIPVAVAVNAIGEQVARVKTVLAKMRQFAGQDESPAAGGAFAPILRQIEGLVQRVAGDLDKQVRLETSFPGLTALPRGFDRFFQEALPQLVRNAVVHGIEPAEERLRAGKPAEGTVRVEIRPHGDGALSLVVRDDGRGISVPTLRRRLVEGGHRRTEEVERMNDQQVVATLFQAGISTADRVTEHAGRGVGLNLVSELATGIGAQLRIASTAGAFTEFTVSMKAA